MEEIATLSTIDFRSAFVSVFFILAGLKASVTVLEWGIGKLGIETKWIRKRREERDLMNEIIVSISEIKEELSSKDRQLDHLMIAEREVLADRINQKYKYYISIQGIPEDELDEFNNLHTAYNLVGGNHGGDAKYEYCISHLDVIPVQTKRKEGLYEAESKKYSDVK